MEDSGPEPNTWGLSLSQRYLMLGLLTLVGTCGTIDRAIIATVQEQIKHEFRLSDSQLGLISGLAFALSHAVVAIPFGALADRVNRKRLIAACLAFWSAATALCGFTGSFLQLVLARMCVGAGEAGGQSAMISTVSDLFPARRRATAISIFYLSVPFGGMAAGAVAGSVAAHHGWRAALYVTAVPGFLLAVILAVFGRIPAHQVAAAGRPSARVASIPDVFRFLSRQRTLLHLIAGIALITLTIVGQSAFSYSFFIRYHNMRLNELGPLLGVSSGVIGIFSMLGAGAVADRIGRNDPRRRLWVIIATIVAITPIVLASYVVAPRAVALPLFMAQALIVNVYLGPGIATIQNLTPPGMRSTIAAIMYVANGLVGFGLGPMVVGVLSDVLAKSFGAQSLRIALMATAALGLWAAVHFYLATRTLLQDLERVGHDPGGL